MDPAEVGEPRQVCRRLQVSERARKYQEGEGVAVPAQPPSTAAVALLCSAHLETRRRAPAWKLDTENQQF